ncbi:hypothetical protein BD770DRAFT_397929 [Pilaira anomala]|nr:hypothetical protein BD770DRAFT_397929 [Pilaira anomala]
MNSLIFFNDFFFSFNIGAESMHASMSQREREKNNSSLHYLFFFVLLFVNMIKNTPKSVLICWAGLAVSAVVAYTTSKNYTMDRLKDYTKNNSVTSSNSYGTQEAPKEGEPLRRSVDRRL